MSDSALDDALAYAARGWHVYPAHNVRKDGACTCRDGASCGSPGKHPRTPHGAADASTSPERIREWWKRWPDARVGMNTGASGVVVLDVELHGATDGRPTWENLAAAHPGLDETLMAGTPHGGWHGFYAANGERVGKPSGFPLGDGIEVLGIGGAVILPSAASPDRDWWPNHEPDARPLAPLPRPIVERVAFASAHREDAGEPAPAEEMPDEIGEGGRRGYLLKMAGALRAVGAPEKTINVALQGINRTVCKPPRTERHVDQIARDIAAKPPGYPVGTRAAAAGAEQEPPQERRHVRAYSLPELAALLPEQVEWVLGDYIAAGDVASLESPPKGGKSTWARKLHVHIALGAPFMSLPVKQGPSLYCTEERGGTSREGFARAGGLHLPDVHVMFLHDFHGMEWAEIVEEVGEHCGRLGVVLVTFDTLSKWAGLVGEEEQGSGYAMEAMAPLQRLAASGPAVLVNRHERKSGGATGEAGRGSSAFAGEVDVILSLRKVTGEKTRRKLGAVGRHDVTPEEVVIDYVNGEYVSLGDPHALRRMEQERAIIALLPSSRATQVGIEELREQLEGVSRETVRSVLMRLLDAGVVCRARGEMPGHPRSAGFWLGGDDD